LTETDAEIEEIRRRVDSARLAKARAEAQLESALSARDQTISILKEEFGLDNLSDARAMLLELKAERDNQLNTIKDLLDQIEQ
jgi:hypothetical protein